MTIVDDAERSLTEMDNFEPRGLMTPEACAELRRLAGLVPAGLAIVEIGSFKGQSTVALARGARDGGGTTVYAIDPWDLPGNPYGKHGYNQASVREDFHRQLAEAGVRSWVIPLRSFSVVAAAQWGELPIGLLYIDGDHERASVLQDYRVWRQHLAPGATVVFDDWGTASNPGVASAVRELRLANEIRVDEIRAGRLCVCHVP